MENVITVMKQGQIETLDNVVEIEQSIGENEPIYMLCGRHSLFGLFLCPDCTTRGKKEGCGKYFVCAEIQGTPSPILVRFADGSTALVDEIISC